MIAHAPGLSGDGLSGDHEEHQRAQVDQYGINRGWLVNDRNTLIRPGAPGHLPPEGEGF
jgi:hypothetical protein